MREALDGLRAAFANTAIRRLQLAAICSTTGQWAYAVALAIFAFDAGGAAAVGIVTVIRTIPSAMLAPVLAVMADRHSRRLVMAVADAVSAAAVAGMTVVAAIGGEPWIAYLLAAVSSIAGTAFLPARAAILPSLAETPEELTAANTASSTIESVGSFAGPALGGAVVSIWDPAAGFGFTAAAYAWSSVTVLRLGADAPPERGEGQELMAEITAGIRTIWRERALRLLVALYGAQTLVAGAVDVLVVVIAFDLVHGGNATVGALYAAIGVGGLVGAAIVLPLAAGRRLAFAFAVGNALWGIPLLALAAAGSEPAALAALALVGIANTVVDVAALTLLQRAVPDEVLARVFGALEGLIVAALGAGAAIAPIAVHLVGVAWTLAALGGLLMVATAAAWPRLRAVDRAAAPPAYLELLRGVPLFAPLPEAVLEQLAGSVETERAADGKVIVSEGESGDRFYVVAEGAVLVQAHDRMVTIPAGGFFGEIALLRAVPRTATVRADGGVTLVTLRRDTFIAAVTGHAPSARAADAVVAQRLEHTGPVR